MDNLSIFDNNESSLKVLRRTGIEFISDIPWGIHLCGLYQSENDLFSMLIPYFKAGLEDNEFCMWITSDPIDPFAAQQHLINAVPNFKEHVKRGQMEILTHKDWYLKYGNFEGKKVLDNWTNKIRKALFNGYDGIRICGNTKWLSKRYWKTFMEYEDMINKEISNLKMIALCTYKLEDCGLNEIIDLVSNHQFTFVHSKDSIGLNETISKFERLNLISSMGATIAHEIRNPMTSVKGFLQLLQNKKVYEEDYDCFSLMIEEIDRANSIIEEFLSLSKNKNSKLQKQNLNTIVSALSPMIQANAIKDNKQAIIELSDVDYLFLDKQEISQLILNLARNGLEAMSHGGILSIKTYLDKNEVILEIEDQGPGIAPEILENLGTPFITSKENGTGLGLSVCYSIAERNNATIAVETSNSGTTFYVKFNREKSI